jgi:hypothetical protein
MPPKKTKSVIIPEMVGGVNKLAAYKFRNVNVVILHDIHVGLVESPKFCGDGTSVLDLIPKWLSLAPKGAKVDYFFEKSSGKGGYASAKHWDDSLLMDQVERILFPCVVTTAADVETCHLEAFPNARIHMIDTRTPMGRKFISFMGVYKYENADYKVIKPKLAGILKLGQMSAFWKQTAAFILGFGNEAKLVPLAREAETIRFQLDKTQGFGAAGTFMNYIRFIAAKVGNQISQLSAEDASKFQNWCYTTLVNFTKFLEIAHAKTFANLDNQDFVELGASAIAFWTSLANDFLFMDVYGMARFLKSFAYTDEPTFASFIHAGSSHCINYQMLIRAFGGVQTITSRQHELIAPRPIKKNAGKIEGFCVDTFHGSDGDPVHKSADAKIREMIDSDALKSVFEDMEPAEDDLIIYAIASEPFRTDARLSAYDARAAISGGVGQAVQRVEGSWDFISSGGGRK